MHPDFEEKEKWYSSRQLWQSLGQFLWVFFTGLLVYTHVPTSLDQLWQPLIQGIVGALGIFGFSKMPTGK